MSYIHIYIYESIPCGRASLFPWASSTFFPFNLAVLSANECLARFLSFTCFPFSPFAIHTFAATGLLARAPAASHMAILVRRRAVRACYMYIISRFIHLFSSFLVRLSLLSLFRFSLSFLSFSFSPPVTGRLKGPTESRHVKIRHL